MESGVLSFYFDSETNIDHLEAMADLGADVLGISEEGNIFEAK